jgi:hypothetical protein
MKDTEKENRWSSIVKSLEDLPQEQIPAGLRQDILSRIDAYEREKQERPLAHIVFTPRPAWALAALLLIAATVFFRMTGRQPLQNERAVLPELHEVSFEVEMAHAKSVSIAGDFNRWDIEKHVLQETAPGRWSIKLKLKPGAYQYQFIVNRKKWLCDFKNPVRIADGFGSFNSGIRI